ncbi:flavin reductase family protein [Actinoallomurus rhizosphaericola]|uniref:flavin reductase family protein n=1 Tax=Actinoallomurus rhizosphaericola TaxID=2952536 RepID=UPI002092CF92|nr:flavin reductase family protein [Actinoallomurus rhizosphaericola]MCO5995683.1 flavin reductase family protein [Actinoallomurus rhizosphaericola]
MHQADAPVPETLTAFRREAGGTERFISGFDYPMFVVTTAADGGRVRAGCLVGFTTQCGIDPFRFLVCLSKKNRTYRVAASASYLAVHVMGRDQQDLATLFGSETGDETDKFARCEWRPGPDGVPLLTRCPRVLVGRVLDRRELGDHIGVLLAPAETHVGSDGGGPLMFSDLPAIDPGHPA